MSQNNILTMSYKRNTLKSNNKININKRDWLRVFLNNIQTKFELFIMFHSIITKTTYDEPKQSVHVHLELQIEKQYYFTF